MQLPPLSKDIKECINEAFIIGRARSPTQDLEYAIEQLVAIALRSLSLNANDTFTANTCLDHLEEVLCLICEKDLKFFHDKEDPGIKLVAKQETFKGLVDASFNQIRQYGSSTPTILIHLLETLTSILSCTRTEEQREVLRSHAINILDSKNLIVGEKDRKDIEERFAHFNSTFQEE